MTKPKSCYGPHLGKWAFYQSLITDTFLGTFMGKMKGESGLLQVEVWWSAVPQKLLLKFFNPSNTLKMYF